MVEVLPIKLLSDEDSQIFGSLNVALAKLIRADLPVAPGIVATAPNLKLKTVLENYDFGTKDIFEQSLTLVRKEIDAIHVPDNLYKEINKHKKFLLNGKVYKFGKELWLSLLHFWIEEIKSRLWRSGFYPGITEGLDAQAVFFVKKIEVLGSAYFDQMQDECVINIKEGLLHPTDLKKLDELIKVANKKLFIPHEYEWIVDGGLKLVGIKPYTASVIASPEGAWQSPIKIASSTPSPRNDDKRSTVKVFLDMSSGLVVEREVDPDSIGVDGIYIASEKIFDLNKPRDSFEDLVFKLVETSATFPDLPILFKLADKSEGLPAGRQGMGKVRGTLRLLHQKSLFDPMIDALDFVRHKRGLNNIHMVIPFVRSYSEFVQIKRELAVNKLGRKNSLQLWLEVAVPENIINLEDYLVAGLDGVVLNLDEMIAHLNGFDHTEGELTFYKNEVGGLLKFLEDGLKLLHKSKIPFIALGSITLNPKVLDFLIEKGVHGVVVERYEAPSIHDLVRQAERRMILRRSS